MKKKEIRLESQDLPLQIVYTLSCEIKKYILRKTKQGKLLLNKVEE